MAKYKRIFGSIAATYPSYGESLVEAFDTILSNYEQNSLIWCVLTELRDHISMILGDPVC